IRRLPRRRRGRLPPTCRTSWRWVVVAGDRTIGFRAQAPARSPHRRSVRSWETRRSMDYLKTTIEKIGTTEALDEIAEPISDLVDRLTASRGVKNTLTGTWLGHPLHPLLTDLPIGLWTGASFLDVFGGKKGAPAAQKLVGLGILAAIPTAATGESDWSDTYG